MTPTTWMLALCLTVVAMMALVGKDLPRRRPSTRGAVTVVGDAVLIAVIAVIGSAGFTVLSSQGGH